MYKLFRLLLRNLRRYTIYYLKWPSRILRHVKLPLTSEIASNAIINDSIVGNYSYIGKWTLVENAQIGNYCSIGNHVQIGGYEHAYWFYSTSHHFKNRGIVGVKTSLDNDVWIGSGAFIKQGIRIGQGAVVAAGAAVVKDVPPYAIVAGVPAKIIKYRFSPEEIQDILKTQFWKYPKKKAIKILNELEIRKI